MKKDMQTYDNRESDETLDREEYVTLLSKESLSLPFLAKKR